MAYTKDYEMVSKGQNHNSMECQIKDRGRKKMVVLKAKKAAG